jgi:hypothetical protein
MDWGAQPGGEEARRWGVRIISCLLPKQSPWLNPIEPKWVHGKRRVVEADGLCSVPTSWRNASVWHSVARTTSTCPSPRRSPDCALVSFQDITPGLRFTYAAITACRIGAVPESCQLRNSQANCA